ncbi:hypothetical protein DFH06DRAFT_1355997 [Mycena polygramma]|nr:hypothetical protein DFH06DRAFT_1355997 [Mycena polygramma]
MATLAQAFLDVLDFILTPEGAEVLSLILGGPLSQTDTDGGLYLYEVNGEIKAGYANSPARRRREWERQCAPEVQIWWPFYWDVPHRKLFGCWTVTASHHASTEPSPTTSTAYFDSTASSQLDPAPSGAKTPDTVRLDPPRPEKRDSKLSFMRKDKPPGSPAIKQRKDRTPSPSPPARSRPPPPPPTRSPEICSDEPPRLWRSFEAAPTLPPAAPPTNNRPTGAGPSYVRSNPQYPSNSTAASASNAYTPSQSRNRLSTPPSLTQTLEVDTTRPNPSPPCPPIREQRARLSRTIYFSPASARRLPGVGTDTEAQRDDELHDGSVDPTHPQLVRRKRHTARPSVPAERLPPRPADELQSARRLASRR